MSHFFIAVYRFFHTYKIAFVLLLLLLIGSVGYLASKIKLEEDISKMMPTDKKVEKLNFVFQNSKFLDKLVVNISLKDSTQENSDELIEFADSLVNRIQSKFISSHVKEITSKISDELMYNVYNSFYDNIPVFLEERDYTQIDALIADTSVNTIIAKNYKTLLSPASMMFKKKHCSRSIGYYFHCA